MSIRLLSRGQIAVPVSREVRRFSHVMHLYTVLGATLGDREAVPQALMARAMGTFFRNATHRAN